MNKDNKKPEILLVTRPLTPPWDEASKNFAYLLAKNLEDFKFHTLMGEYDPKLPKRVTQHVIYRGPSWTTLQKTKLVLKLYLILKRNPSINTIHFLFAPTPFNTKVLKNLVKSFPVKVIQTIASIPKNAKDRINSALFADKLIVYSDYALGQLKGSNQNKASVIPPFIDFTGFPLGTKKAREAVREKWKIGKEKKIILYPGEYGRLGAMEPILKGFMKINKSLPEAKLFMACRIKKREDDLIERKFKKDISLAGLSSSVNFLGRVDDINELYLASDLIVFPVRYMEGKSLEGKFDFPFVLLESLACGTPILTSDVAALPEIWKGNAEYRKKYVFPSERTDLFIKKTLEILRDDKNNAREFSKFVIERFNKDKILEEYTKMYNSL